MMTALLSFDSRDVPSLLNLAFESPNMSNMSNDMSLARLPPIFTVFCGVTSIAFAMGRGDSFSPLYHRTASWQKSRMSFKVLVEL